MNQKKPGHASATANRPKIGHLNLAIDYTSDAWFPANQPIFKDLLVRMRAGEFIENRKELVEHLKNDQAQYLLCIKALSEIANQSSSTEIIIGEPTTLLKNSSDEQLANAVYIAQAKSIKHSLAGLESNQYNDQIKRIQFTSIAACTTEVLASQSGIDDTLSYSTVLFKQLGLTLISWNYPHIYRRAIKLAQNGGNIDSIIGKILGFSPSLLGITLIRRWNICPEILYCMGDRERFSRIPPELHETTSILLKLCRIGETLAELNDPESYPCPTDSWENLAPKIADLLGHNGLEQIYKLVEQRCKQYRQALPETFKFALLEPLAKRTKLATPLESQAPIINNPYIKRCPEICQDHSRYIYTEIGKGKISKEVIDRLVGHITLNCGFNSGCMYIVSPDSQTLEARLAIGQATLENLPSINLLYGSETQNPILAAFRSNNLISGSVTKEDLLPFSALSDYITSSIGKSHKIGVLVLTYLPQEVSVGLVDMSIYFKAIRQAFDDCFELY